MKTELEDIVALRLMAPLMVTSAGGKVEAVAPQWESFVQVDNFATWRSLFEAADAPHLAAGMDAALEAGFWRAGLVGTPTFCGAPTRDLAILRVADALLWMAQPPADIRDQVARLAHDLGNLNAAARFVLEAAEDTVLYETLAPLIDQGARHIEGLHDLAMSRRAG